MQEMQEVMASADELYSLSAVHDAASRVSREITDQLHDQSPILLCLMNGGLNFCGMLMERLNFPLEFDYLHATRYRGETSGQADLIWRMKPSLNLSGRSILVVDDILDEGPTLKAVIDQCHASGASKVYSSVMVNKIHDRRKPEGFKADFVGLDIPDRYVFGCGMDYKGFWRNAPGIFAVKGL